MDGYNDTDVSTPNVDRQKREDIEQPAGTDIPVPPDTEQKAPVEEPPEKDKKAPIKEDNTEPKKLV